MSKEYKSLKKIKNLQKEAIGAYNRFADIAREVHQAVKDGGQGAELISRLREKDRLADELVELAGKISRERENFGANEADLAMLKNVVDEFNEVLRPILTELIAIEENIGKELKRAGIKISNRKI